MAAKKKEAASKAPNLHFLYGGDEALVKEAALKLAHELVPPAAGEFGLETVDGMAENADHAGQICRRVVEALQTLPFFGGGKVVWLRHANFLADTQTGRAQAATEGLESILEVVEPGLPPDVHFVLSAGAVDKRRSFFLKFDKLAQSKAFDLPDTSQRGWEAEVEALIAGRAKDLGLSFETEAMELFLLLAGERTQQIISELEKLDLYLGPDRRRITAQDVRTMVPLSRAGVIFELGNAIGRRDARRALALLDSLLAQGESAIGLLLAAIIPKMRNLMLARELVEQHRAPLGSYPQFQGALERLPAEETAHLPKKKDGGLNAYPLFLAAQESKAFTEKELRQGLRACLRANHRLVGSSLDPKVVLAQLVVELLAGEPKRPAARPVAAARR